MYISLLLMMSLPMTGDSVVYLSIFDHFVYFRLKTIQLMYQNFGHRMC